jgi:hypothetical protein
MVGLILLIFAPRDADSVTLPPLRTPPLGKSGSPQRRLGEELDDASGVVGECPTSGDLSVLHVVDLGSPDWSVLSPCVAVTFIN